MNQPAQWIVLVRHVAPYERTHRDQARVTDSGICPRGRYGTFKGNPAREQFKQLQAQADDSEQRVTSLRQQQTELEQSWRRLVARADGRQLPSEPGHDVSSHLENLMNELDQFVHATDPPAGESAS